MVNIRRRQAIIACSQALLLPFFVSCASDSSTSATNVSLSYTPPFLPISFSISSDGNISVKGNLSIVTPLGTFDIGVDVSSSLKPDDHTLDVVIRHLDKGSPVDTAYAIQTGQSEVVVVTNGTTLIDITQHKVFIDASAGSIQTIDIKDSSVATTTSSPDQSTTTSTGNRPARLTWKQNTPIRGQTSTQAPALVMFQNTLCLAYVDNNDNYKIKLIFSSDGVNWTNSLTIGDSSHSAPTLAVLNSTTLYLMYRADDAGLYCTSSHDGKTWTSDQSTWQSSKAAPVLTTFNNSLYATFVNNDWFNNNPNLHVISSSDNVTWTDVQTMSNEVSSLPPALVSWNNTLYLAYVDTTRDNNLFITSSKDGTTWSGDLKIGQASKTAPAFAIWNGTLYLAFVANDPSKSLLIINSSDGVNWSHNQQIHQSSSTAPSLTIFNNTLYAAFVANNAGNELLLISASGA
jgi:hypothetical protein